MLRPGEMGVEMTEGPPLERRRYRRIQAPILMRPAGLLAQVAARKVNDISLGGIRTYADEAVPKGRRLEIELLYQDGGSSTVLVEVAWVEPVAPGGAAAFEMGLRLVDARPADLERLAAALKD
jgi:23S rRNA G2445 N2-methylase RlmL